MNIIENKKGFTLIELLAVIVILSIIILIAAQNVGGMTTTARKNVLASEGNILVDTAKTAYQLAVLDGSVTTGSACFSLAYLFNQGLFDKGPTSSPKYTGSVLVTPANGGKSYSYTFWISNSSYATPTTGLPMGSNGKSLVNFSF